MWELSVLGKLSFKAGPILKADHLANATATTSLHTPLHIHNTGVVDDSEMELKVASTSIVVRLCAAGSEAYG